MVLGFGQGFIAAQSQLGQIGAQSGQGLLIQKTTQVVRGKQIHLGLAQATKKGIVFGGDLAWGGASGDAHQQAPWFFQKAP